MESPTTKVFTGDLVLSPEQQKHVVMRAAYCSADNCYRALFPCPSPWVVTEAVRYCATISAGSATNYPTQAVAACGTGKERYISACSCPATNCPVGITSQTTTTLDTAQPVPTTNIEEKAPPESDPAPIITPHQIPSTATGGGAVPTQAHNNDAGRSDEKSSMGSVSEAMVTEASAMDNTSPDHVSSAQAVDEGKSVAGSQSLLSPSSPSLSSQPFPAPLGQSSTPVSSLPPVLFPQTTPKTGSTASSGTTPPETTSPPPGSAVPSTPANRPEGLGAGLVAAIAVGATLAALVLLLLLGAAAYCCCLKRRTARRRGARLRALTLTLSQESILDTSSSSSSEWKPPVELPYQNTSTTVRRHVVELEDSPTSLRAQLDDDNDDDGDGDGDDDASTLPVTPSSSLSTGSSLAPRNAAAEMQGAPPRPPRPSSPVELFVMPAELPGVYRI